MMTDTLTADQLTEPSASTEDANDNTQARKIQAKQEQAVGITTFASLGDSGIQCVFKQRYTDFQVNEILPSGEVLHLTEIAGPQPKRQDKRHEEKSDGKTETTQAGQKRAPDEEDETATKRQKLDEEHATEPEVQNMEHATTGAEISEDDRTTLVSIYGGSVTEEILKLHSAVVGHPDRKPRDHVTVKSEVIESKATRTQAHSAVRKIFDSKLETATLQEEPGRMTIRAAALRSDKPMQGREYNTNANGTAKRGRLLWEELGGEYLHFTLFKENKDTMEVLYFMASQLKVKINTFSFAGTKDRRGVTVQRVAVFKIPKERLISLAKLARGWKIGGFEHKKHGLELGGLKGNEFVLTLRDCVVPGTESLTFAEKLRTTHEIVTKAATDLVAHGYINFYGLQRFGSFQTGTHTVGLKMLQNDLEAAIDCILTYDPAVLSKNLDEETKARIPKDDIDRADAIHSWRESKNANIVRDRMPRRFQSESNIIQYLSRRADGHKQEKDWQGALMCIQRGLRSMYVHAYQSFVWNKAAVKRREVYGNRVVEGDLVIVGEKDDSIKKPEDRTDQDGEIVVHPSESDEQGSAEDSFIRGRALSKEEAESGHWNIFDIILPLPGWDVLYPANDIGKFYEVFMGSEEGGHLDPYNMRRSWRDVSLPGGYRKLMSRPLGKVDVQTHPYTGEQQLAETDVDRLMKQQHDPMATSNGEHETTKVAVVLQLQLGSSQYATMALRELCKGGAIAYKPEFAIDRQRPR